jgi:hypothetical protein
MKSSKLFLLEDLIEQYELKINPFTGLPCQSRSKGQIWPYAVKKDKLPKQKHCKKQTNFQRKLTNYWNNILLRFMKYFKFCTNIYEKERKNGCISDLIQEMFSCPDIFLFSIEKSQIFCKRQLAVCSSSPWKHKPQIIFSLFLVDACSSKDIFTHPPFLL